MEAKEALLMQDAARSYYDRFSGAIYSYVRGILFSCGKYSKQQADDLSADVWLNLLDWLKKEWEREGQPPSQEFVKRMLWTIARNECIDSIKKIARRETWEVLKGDVLTGDEATSGNVKEIEPPAGSPTPEQALLSQELRARLENCLKGLRPEERSAILYRIQGRSDKEIAALIHKDAKTVTHSIIPLAKGKLYPCMEGYLHGTRTKRLYV
jgi:RNA polymerase sigma factor (sigma-70 family)